MEMDLSTRKSLAIFFFGDGVLNLPLREERSSLPERAR